MPKSASPPFSVFISYAHADDNDSDVSKRYLHRCRRQLASLTRQGRVTVFTDKDIEIGDRWRDLLIEAIQNARAAVLLVGPEFFCSEFIRQVEVPMLLQKAESEELTILVVILSPVFLEDNVFKYPDAEGGPHEKSLSHFQSANRPERPLNSLTEHQQESVFLDVAQRIRQILNTPPRVATTAPGDQAEVHVRAVEGALDLLSDLLRTSTKVRDAVRQFRSTFEEASADIERLNSYKALHDLLHALQFECLDMITVELSRFPLDSESEDRLMGPQQDLETGINAINTSEQRWKKIGFSTTRLLEDLYTARADLQAAIAHQDKAKLKRARFCIDRVLNTYPVRINTLLLASARRLDLPKLIGTMNQVKSQLIEVRVAPEHVQEFIAGVQSLTALDVRLRDLLYEHDEWQTADGEMRIVDVTTDDFFENLEMSWPRVKVITEILYRENTAPRALELEKDSQRVDAALQSRNLSTIKSAYRRFRRCARLRFYEVDTELLELCSKLQAVGEPLDTMLQHLDPSQTNRFSKPLLPGGSN